MNTRFKQIDFDSIKDEIIVLVYDHWLNVNHPQIFSNLLQDYYN